MIQLKNVTKKLDGRDIIRNVSLDIREGSSVALAGANGAGKSTLLRLISGIYQSDSGSVTIDGEEVFDHPTAKQKVFFVNDETVQFTRFSMPKLKKFYQGFYPTFSEEEFDKLRENLHLPADRPLSTFSKGMKRQAITITAIASGAPYLLMDESFDGLDPAMRETIKKVIFDAMAGRHLTVLISSHNLKEIGEFCDHCAILHEGQILSAGGIDSSDPEMFRLQLAFQDETPEISMKPHETFRIIHVSRLMSVYTIIVKGKKEDIRKYFEAMNPVLMDFVPLSLEETFIYEMEDQNYGK